MLRNVASNCAPGEGSAIVDFMNPARIVLGSLDKEAAHKVADLHLSLRAPIVVTDLRTAEMIKYASNAFLATKISFINEMANLCEAYGADINSVRQGMCADKRIGSAFLYPGLGYGGSCFPKDTLACIMMGDQAGMEAKLSKAVHEVNQKQRDRFFDKIVGHFGGKTAVGGGPGGLQGKTFAFWGVAFKPRTDDIREAPALTLIRKAVGYGVKAVAYDPVAADNAKAELGPSVPVVTDMYDALKGADALVISTDWDEFKSPDFSRLLSSMKRPAIFDGRNLYKNSQMSQLGFHYYSVGRAPATPK